MGRFKIILLAVIAVVTFSCSSSDKDNAPQLTITFPTSETTFVRSNSFTFSGTATDDVELKKISFSLYLVVLLDLDHKMHTIILHSYQRVILCRFVVMFVIKYF